MRAAIYARYSSDNQRDASIEDQIRITREKAAAESWDVTEVFTDHAISGASLLRPGMQALMRRAALGEFDIILCEAMDRLSRDQEDIAGLFKRMQFAGVRIITLAEGEINSLHVGLKGTMNALFLKDLADKTRRGQRGRVEKGKSGGGLTYGYDVVKRIDQDGDYARGERAINAQQADIVRRIFREMIEGRSASQVAKRFNAEGIKGPHGGTWSAGTILGNRRRGTGIINNELYIGRNIWNKLRYVKDPSSGRRISRMNDEKDWVISEAPELRIIPQDVWDAFKVMQGEFAPHVALHTRNRPKHLLSGLIKCGCCGSNYTQNKGRLGCSGYKDRNICDNRATIALADVEDRVINALHSHLMDDELCAEFCQEYMRRMNELRSEHNASLRAYRAEYAKLERDREQIIKAITDGIDVSLIKDRANAIQKRREEIEIILQAEKDEPVAFHPAMSARYKNAVKELIKLLNADSTRNQASASIRSLIDSIVLTPDEYDDLVIDLYGDLAGILSVATQQERQAVEANLSQLQPVKSDDDFGETKSLVDFQKEVLVAGAGLRHQPPESQKAPISRGPQTGFANALLVAGAGFEPATFRL
ncbi:recombinase family protein [Roseovarius sp.]|uniref:recombinase family protein n=1 Tax=Roseovarius sp. TaxID=1486281 RepID=UPI003A974945